MASRPNFQFANNADEKEARDLIEKIQDAWYCEELKDFEEALDNIKGEWPEATVTGTIPKISAGEIVLRLLRNEVEELERKK